MSLEIYALSDILFGRNFLSVNETSRGTSTFHSSTTARSVETGESTERGKVSCAAGILH